MTYVRHDIFDPGAGPQERICHASVEKNEYVIEYVIEGICHGVYVIEYVIAVCH